MTDPWAERMSDYLDGELNAEEVAALESHLLDCASCNQAVKQLRTVVARLGGDPIRHPDQPTHQGWSRIEESIAPRRRRWIWSAAIAASLAALALAAGLWYRQTSSGDDRSRLVGFPADYRQATTDLETILRKQRNQLRPETVRAVESSLATIDSAIAQAARALAADPANEYITRYLAQLRDTRITALRDAVALMRQGG